MVQPLLSRLEKEIWTEEMAPQWETHLIGEMPSRRDYTVAEIFMLIDMRYQSLQGKKADLICTGERDWQGLIAQDRLDASCTRGRRRQATQPASVSES